MQEISNIQVSPQDNVSVVVDALGGKKGDVLKNTAIKLLEATPLGHKVALQDLKKDDAIIRYNQVIAYAKQDLAAGSWVNEHNTIMPVSPSMQILLDEYNEEDAKKFRNTLDKELSKRTFLAYKNPDGSFGTKNILALSMSVQCVAGIAEHLVKRVKKELLPKYPNVDDVISLNHSYGCGIAKDAKNSNIPIRTLQNLALNPNFGNQTLVLSLGCEKLRPTEILFNPKELDELKNKDIVTLQDTKLNGFQDMIAAILEQVEERLKILNTRKREPAPLSKLVLGAQCGGSYALSGLTANPVVGFVIDLLVRAGASVMFSEVTEVRDAIALLIPRSLNKEVAEKLVAEMQWYDNYLETGGTDRSANTTPGNKKGGLSNIVEKALGSSIKSGNFAIVDVLSPGEKLTKAGVNFAATPAGDFICGTLQAASGSNIQIFTTGRGTPYNIAINPVIKIASNTPLKQKWSDLIDFNAGLLSDDEASLEDLGYDLFEMVIDIASGKKQTCAEQLGIYNDLVLFNPAPVT